MASGQFHARVRALPIVAGLGVAAGMIAILVPTGVAAPPSCAVSNAATNQTYNSLQAAVDAAKARGTLEVKGRCVGTTTVGKEITIKGKAGPGTPTLDGGGAGTVVHITRGTTTIEGLKIVNGVADVVSVEGNGCCVGGGIAVSGDRAGARLVDSLVTGNSATVFGGGIDVDAGTLTLVDSTVSENTAARRGGGIVNQTPTGGPGAVLTLSGTASITDNQAFGDPDPPPLGGGIWIRGGATVNATADWTGSISGNTPDQCSPTVTIC